MKEFICQENGCGKTYTNPYNLKRHQVIKHLKTKAFKCSLCGRELSSMQNLKEHESMHNGDKPYKCNLCNAKYRYCSQLSNHRKLHKKEKKDSVFIELKLTDLMKIHQFSLTSLEDDEEFVNID